MNQILSILTGKQTDESVIDQGFIGNNQQTAGCFIKTDLVYSICVGTVLAVERDVKTATWCVTVEIDSQHWIRYCGLSSAKVAAGDRIEISTMIGYAYKHLMKLEYCTSEQSQFPVRILSRQLYKQDPTIILFSLELLTEVF